MEIGSKNVFSAMELKLKTIIIEMYLGGDPEGFALMCNDIVGSAVPEYSNYVVLRVVHFQIIEYRNATYDENYDIYDTYFTAFVLAEIERAIIKENEK